MTTNIRQNIFFILVLIVLLSLQSLLFIQYVIREIVWAYPTWNDQAYYLSKSYQLVSHIFQHDFFTAIWHELLRPKPNGSLIHIEAALAFLTGGANRLTAHSINMLHLILFQIITLLVIYRLSKSLKICIIALSFLLCAQVIYVHPGGIFDFRIDFMSFCTYGIVVILFLNTDFLIKKRNSILWGVSCAICVATRHILFAYITSLLFSLAVYLAFYYILRPETRNYTSIRLKHLFISCIAFFVALLPFAIISYSQFLTYYIDQAFIRGPVRQTSGQHESILELLAFYPTQIWTSKIGNTAKTLFVITIAFWITNLFFFKKPNKLIYNTPNNYLFLSNLFFLLFAILIPIGILTFNPAKSIVVGGIIVFPLIILFLYISTQLLPHTTSDRQQRTFSFALNAITILFCISSLGAIFNHYSQPSYQTRNRHIVKKYMNFYHTFACLCYSNNLSEITILNDYITDFLEPPILSVIAYEKYQFYINIKTLGRTQQIFHLDEAMILNSSRNADFMIITTTHQSKRKNMHYPYNAFMLQIQPKLMDIAEQHFLKVGEWQAGNDVIHLYINEKHSQIIPASVQKKFPGCCCFP